MKPERKKIHNSLHFWGKKIHKTNSNQAETDNKNNIGKNYIYIYFCFDIKIVFFFSDILFTPQSSTRPRPRQHFLYIHSIHLSICPSFRLILSSGKHYIQWECTHEKWLLFLFTCWEISKYWLLNESLSLFQVKVLRWVHITVSSAVNGSGDSW